MRTFTANSQQAYEEACRQECCELADALTAPSGDPLATPPHRLTTHHTQCGSGAHTPEPPTGQSREGGEDPMTSIIPAEQRLDDYLNDLPTSTTQQVISVLRLAREVNVERAVEAAEHTAYYQHNDDISRYRDRADGLDELADRLSEELAVIRGLRGGPAL